MVMKKYLAIAAIFGTLASVPQIKGQSDELMNSLDGTSSHIDGPNCWNGALYAAGVLPNKRFLDPNEWTYHLRTTCSEVDVPQSGDVGRLFYQEEEQITEVHGFIHLDQDSVFAKHGEAIAHGYQFMSYEEMMDQYGRTRDCRLSGSSDASCFHRLKYYRCRQEAKSLGPWPEVHHLLEEILFEEETKWKFKEKCDGAIFLARNERMQQMDELFKRALKESAPIGSQDKELLLNYAASFSHQLYNIQVSQRAFRCHDRKFRDQVLKSLKRSFKSYKNRLESL